MNKAEFLAALRERLSGLPEEDFNKSIDYYTEMIDDRVEDGMSEEEAVACLGSMDEIITQILSEVSLPKLVKEKVKPKRALAVWEIILIIISAPIWFPIVFSVVTTILSAYLSQLHKNRYHFYQQVPDYPILHFFELHPGNQPGCN